MILLLPQFLLIKKEELIGRIMKINCFSKNKKGFSTIEILVAMAVLAMCFSAIILISFSGQSMLISSQTNSEAINMAQELLEKAQADARKDFNLVNPVAATTTADGFTLWVDVEQKDNFTKLVTAYVDFPEDSDRHGNTKLSAIVTNFNNAVGGDTCSSVLLPNAEDWKAPTIQKKFFDFSGLTGITDKYSITDIDAYQGKLYVTIGDTVASTTPTL